MDAVLDWVRNSAGPGLTRRHITTRQDLYNIATAFNICNTERLHENDVLSVKEWVMRQNEMKDGMVMFCKLQNEEPLLCYESQDFALFIMTTPQAEVLQKFGKEKICVDTTHGTTMYDFQLTTLLTVDEFGGGVPCAFCISTKVDTAVMAHFFSCVKQRVGKLHAMSFMSDDAPEYYNAWEEVMGAPTHRLLCAWHVDRNWRKNIMRYVQGNILKATVYKTCRILLDCEDEGKLAVLCREFLEKASEVDDTKEFAAYFRKHYANRPQQWALCYRKGTGINTNMYLESLHKTIKHVYLKGTQNRRVDTLISCLVRLTHDKLYDRVIKLCKGKQTHRIQSISRSHMLSMDIAASAVKFVENGEHKVESQTTPGTVYTVAKRQETCNCQLVCQACGICAHNFTCTCHDHLVKLNICKHIHVVARLLKVHETSSTAKDTCTLAEAEHMLDQARDVQDVQKEISDTAYVQKAATVGEALLGCLKMGKVSESQAKKMHNCFERLLRDISNETSVNKALRCAPNRHIEPQMRFRSVRKGNCKKDIQTVMRKPTPTEKVRLLDSLSSRDEREDIHTGDDHSY